MSNKSETLDFLNTVFIFATFLTIVLSVVISETNPLLSNIAFIFALFYASLLVVIKLQPKHIDVISWLAISSCYLLFTITFAIAPEETTRITLFFPLLAAVYFLKGKTAGGFFLVLILSSTLLITFFSSNNFDYTLRDIFISSSYIVGFFLILNNFESVRKKQSDELFVVNKKLKTELNKTEEELVVAVEATMKDEISGLNSRSKFTKMANFELEQSKNYNFPLCLMALDINEFAMINTVYGSAIGDEVLRNVANTINNSKRDSDIAVRWAADEFFILLPKSSISDAIQIAEKIKKDLISNSNLNRYCVSISFGFTQYMTPDKLNRLISQVEDHLIRTKQRNKT